MLQLNTAPGGTGMSLPAAPVVTLVVWPVAVTLFTSWSQWMVQ